MKKPQVDLIMDEILAIFKKNKIQSHFICFNQEVEDLFWSNENGDLKSLSFISKVLDNKIFKSFNNQNFNQIKKEGFEPEIIK
jgi:hypothetical protein